MDDLGVALHKGMVIDPYDPVGVDIEWYRSDGPFHRTLTARESALPKAAWRICPRIVEDLFGNFANETHLSVCQNHISYNLHIFTVYNIF